MSTTVTWTATSSGDWSNAANWSDDAVPNSNDNVTIATSSVQTITYDSGNDTINELSVGNDHFIMAGGSLEILTTATFNDGFIQTGGTLENGTLTVLKSGTLTGGSATGSTVLNIAGGIALSNYTLAGSAVLNNASNVISQTGGITVGDNTGVDATINNESKGTYQIAGDYGVSSGAASAVIDNAGLFEKTNGSSTSNVNIDIDSTGTISAASGGTLAFGGPNNVISGALTGAGTIEFDNAGNSTVTLGTITSSTVEIESATVTLGTNTTLSGSLDETAGSALSIGANSVTLKGAVNSIGLNGTALVTGTGTLDNTGTLSLAAMQLGGSATLDNSGTVDQVYNVVIGDSSGAVADVINAAGGTWSMAAGYQLEAGSSTAQTFTNDGSFALSGPSGDGSSVEISFNNAAGASIAVATGNTLTFDGVTTNAGSMIGAGTVQFANSAAGTLAAGTTLTSAGLDITDSASLTLATSLAYSGVFTENAYFGGTTLNLGGDTLSLSGSSNSISGFEGGSTVSAGTLANSGTLNVGELTLSGSITLDNTGTLIQAGGVTDGDGGGDLAAIINAAGSVYEFASSLTLGVGDDSNDSFSNAGTIETTQNTASTIDPLFSNEASATILAAAGSTLTFSNLFTNAGTIGGSGEVQFINSSSATFSAGTTLTGGAIDVTDAASLTLGTSLSYAGVFTENANFGDTTVNVGSTKFTLSGTGNSISGFEGGSTVTGSGTLVNSGTLAVGELTLGSTVTLDNTALVNQAGNVAIGDGSGKVAIIDNAAGATWNLDNGSGITDGAASTSTFENYGIFSASPGSGSTATVNTTFVNEKGGTVKIGTGLLDSSGTFINDGTISGPDFQAINSSSTTLNAGTNLNSLKEFDLLDGATLTLGTNLTYSGTFDVGANFGSPTIDLAAHTLTLKGSAIFTAFEGGSIINGGGTLSLAGTTQLAGLTVGSTSLLSNAGTIDAAGNLQVGDGSGKAAEFLNAAKSVYDLVNNSGISVGSSLLSDFVNNGLFEKTAGSGTSVVSAPFVNNGTITVSGTGTLEFTAGSLSGNGVINGTETTDNYGDIFITAKA
jgi:hypothetical protein